MTGLGAAAYGPMLAPQMAQMSQMAVQTKLGMGRLQDEQLQRQKMAQLDSTWKAALQGAGGDVGKALRDPRFLGVVGPQVASQFENMYQQRQDAQAKQLAEQEAAQAKATEEAAKRAALAEQTLFYGGNPVDVNAVAIGAQDARFVAGMKPKPVAPEETAKGFSQYGYWKKVGADFQYVPNRQAMQQSAQENPEVKQILSAIRVLSPGSDPIMAAIAGLSGQPLPQMDARQKALYDKALSRLAEIWGVEEQAPSPPAATDAGPQMPVYTYDLETRELRRND